MPASQALVPALDPRRFHRQVTIALSAVLAVLGVGLVIAGLTEGTPTKVILGIVVVGGGLARIVIERRRAG